MAVEEILFVYDASLEHTFIPYNKGSIVGSDNSVVFHWPSVL